MAVAGTYAIFRALSPRLFTMNWLPDIWVIAIVAAGAILGGLSSLVAVRRHLGEIQ